VLVLVLDTLVFVAFMGVSAFELVLLLLPLLFSINEMLSSSLTNSSPNLNGLICEEEEEDDDEDEVEEEDEEEEEYDEDDELPELNNSKEVVDEVVNGREFTTEDATPKPFVLFCLIVLRPTVP
jgi:hypothetical protein